MGITFPVARVFNKSPWKYVAIFVMKAAQSAPSERLSDFGNR